MTIQIGDRIPNTTLLQMTEQGPAPISSVEALGTGRVVLFAVPGAFTPTCSVDHLPSFVSVMDELKAAGVDRIACTATNDIFVLNAWAQANDAMDITMLADGNGELTQAMGLGLDASAFGMGQRCQRYAMVIDDGVVSHLAVEAPGAFEVSSGQAVLAALKAQA
jgi:peroxiredoxin